MDNILNFTPAADVSVSYIRSITNETVYAPWKHKWTQSQKIYKIIYVLKGEYSATVDGKNFHIKENDIFYSSTRNFSSKSLTDVFSSVCIYFEISDETLLGDDFFKVSHLISNCAHLKNKFINIFNEFHSNSFRYKLVSRKLLYDILDNIYNESMQKSSIPIDLYAIKNAIEYMEKNYASEDITIEYLASLCKYTPVHFINLFKRIYSVTPKSYLINLRIDKAKELLLYTSLPVNEIAEKVGYSTAAHFSAVFKMLNGMSPLNFRKQFSYLAIP